MVPGSLYLNPFSQSFSQGKTDSGLEFKTFAGQDWDDIIEKTFQNWALQIFGGTYV